MFIFGDSLTDTGNLFGLSLGAIPPSPPYAGKVSNGPTWLEQMAVDLGLAAPNNVYPSGSLMGGINNFAVGGAHTGPRPFDFPGPVTLPSRNTTDEFVGLPLFPGVTLPGAFLSQVDLFSLLSGGSAPADAWYTIWAGANDLVSAPDFSPSGRVNASAVVPSAVGDIRTAIESLAAQGAEEYLIFNLPDLGSTPLGILTGRSAERSAGTDLFNEQLDIMVDDVAATLAIDIVLLDIHRVFANLLADVIADPIAAGFPDASILTPLGVPPGFSFCIDQTTLTDICGPLGLDPNNRVFWDLLHPSERTHGLIAAAAIDAKVPEPGTLMLVSLTLVGFGLSRLRRRFSNRAAA